MENDSDYFEKLNDDYFSKELTLTKESNFELAKNILKIMIPSFVNLVLAELLFQINIIFVSKLNDESMLAGIGLANAIIYCFPLSLTYGISSVLETLVS